MTFTHLTDKFNARIDWILQSLDWYKAMLKPQTLGEISTQVLREQNKELGEQLAILFPETKEKE